MVLNNKLKRFQIMIAAGRIIDEAIPRIPNLPQTIKQTYGNKYKKKSLRHKLTQNSFPTYIFCKKTLRTKMCDATAHSRSAEKKFL
jgi:hypothetical protein